MVLGGVLRSDSPFLDAFPLGEMPVEAIGLVSTAALTPVAPTSLDDPVSENLGNELEAQEAEAPFDREAVARACARAARPVQRAEATVMTDDGVAEHVCDVSAWLAGATVREVEALVRSGWSGAPAEEVAATLADDDPEVADVVRHARRAESDLIVEIDGAGALAWLARHRPEIAAALDSSEEADDEGADDEGE